MCIFYFKYKKVDLCYVIDVDLSFYLWYMEVLFVFEMKLSYVYVF